MSMKFQVLVPPTDPDGFEVSIDVEGANWSSALRTALKQIGEGAESIKSITCEVQPDGAFKITDKVSKRVFVVQPLDAPPVEAAPAPAAPTAAPATAAIDEAKQKADEEARQRAADEARQRAEAEAKQRADAEAKQRAEAEAKQKADEQKRKADEEAQRAEAEAKQKAEQEVLRALEVKKSDEKAKAEAEAKPKPAQEAKPKSEEEQKRTQEIKKEAKKPDDKKKRDKVTGETIETRAGGNDAQLVGGDVVEFLREAFDAMFDLFEIRNAEEASYFVLDQSLAKVPSEGGAIFFSDLGRRDLYPTAARGPMSKNFMNNRVQLGKGIVGFSALKSVSLAVPNVEYDHRWDPSVKEAPVMEVRSILSVPLYHKGRSYGVLLLANRAGNNSYSRREVSVIIYFAEQLARWLHDNGE
jgi:hypothetical protein